jgi:polysaccharide pyruvyl transferase WcaK-like protein
MMNHNDRPAEMDGERPPAQTVALLEHFGTGNLGDDTTVEAVVRQIASRWPDASIVALSLNPADTEARHGIRSYPIRRMVPTAEWWTPADSRGPAAGGTSLRARIKNAAKLPLRKTGLYRIALPMVEAYREARFLRRSFRVAKTFDLLVVSGGGQLLDTWGPWGFPYTLFKWTLLARLSGARCYFLNVGAGPLTGRLGKWLVKASLRRASHVSYRDGKSQALIRAIGYRGEAQVVADNVYALEVSGTGAVGRQARDEPLVIGISPMAYFDPRRYWERDQAVYDVYIREIAAFGAELLREGHRLRLFSSDIWFDSQAIADVRAAIGERVAESELARVSDDPVTSLDDFMGQLTRVDCVLTCRYHGVVFAHIANVPTLALAHHPKISTLMEDFGLSEYCIDIRGFDAALLMARFRQLIADMPNVTTRIPREVAARRRELHAQFDSLFPRARREPEPGEPLAVGAVA